MSLWHGLEKKERYRIQIPLFILPQVLWHSSSLKSS